VTAGKDQKSGQRTGTKASEARERKACFEPKRGGRRGTEAAFFDGPCADEERARVRKQDGLRSLSIRQSGTALSHAFEKIIYRTAPPIPIKTARTKKERYNEGRNDRLNEKGVHL